MKLPPGDHMHGGVLQPLLNPVTHSYKLVLFSMYFGIPRRARAWGSCLQPVVEDLCASRFGK